jgi:ParB-like chromosome segregation protein Spo0J
MGDIPALFGLNINTHLAALIEELAQLPDDDRIDAINQIKLALHEVSPMRDEPVDCVLWVPADDVQANNYNPNVVAPPEMKLLRKSIDADGFTQPIVTYPVNGHREVVDGFHLNRVGKEVKAIKKRLRGYLPVTTIRSDRQDREDRIAATIRHNRARGKHTVDNMSEIVVELSRRNWSNEKIGRELGMEPDEVLRLKQISGLAELFADREFSEAWEIE